MTPEGYKIVCTALSSYPDISEFTVNPEPQLGEDAPRVEITILGIDPRPILRALGAAGLTLKNENHNIWRGPDAPRLAFTSALIAPETRDKITISFRDDKVFQSTSQIIDT